jgi:hypothetical protein
MGSTHVNDLVLGLVMKGAVAAGRHARLVPAVLAGLSLLVLVSWLLAGPARSTVVVYGDSLTVQSEQAARLLRPGLGAAVVFRARGGTAMCDWISQADYDRLALHPERVVLAFTGNTATCAKAAFLSGGVAGADAVYEHSLRQMRAIFANVPITVLIPPAMRNLPYGWFPFNGNPSLVAMYKRVGAELHMTVNPDADDWLTPGHVFTTTRPAYPNGWPVDVRLSDGVHLTPAGALWYGKALLESKPPGRSIR